jgi:preprotein translocase subunit SecA
MEHYDAKWNNTFDVSQFRDWAVSKKGHLEDSEIHEALAVMKRTIEVINGYDLRTSSILSALVFLRKNNFKGRLVQIQTLVGKTNIVSLIAAIKVLQGKKVDVVTSSEVLATEGVDSTKKFFGVLGISVATNNPDDSYKSGGRECYKADVVYGNIGNFQFDYLRDFSEDLGTRGGREFSVVILDEADNMLLDNGGHIAKLAAPFPGMDILKYIYIKIWEELHVAEEEIVSESLRKITEFPGNSSQQYQSAMYGQTPRELERSTDKIAEKIKSTHPENIKLIPPYLKDYAKSMLDRWIHNALYAKYSCTENREYVIRKVKGEDFIIPIDYVNTGVTMRNTIWSDGLHQFVQLKHNLQITTETLTSSFISNFGYIKFYQNIFGMTGTLVSIAELAIGLRC